MARQIDNLNFGVILDDKDFKKKVENDIKIAKNFNIQLSQLLNLKTKIISISAQEAASAKRASDIAAKQAINQQKVVKATSDAATAMNRQRAAAANAATAMARATSAQDRLSNATKRSANASKNQSKLLGEAKTMLLGYLSISGMSHFISSLARVTGEFEMQKTTLAAMIKDLDKAENIISEIKTLAVKSPFQFKELTTYTKQLSAFSVPAEELFETTKMLADISAGLGVGMDRIILAYGQVKSAAFLRGQEVRQFTEAGIPILDELAKQFTELEGRAISTGEVFDRISARLVPFEMVAKVMKDLTSEGGKFYNMQEIQADTLKGKISNLADAYEIMLNEIGSSNSGILKGSVDMLRSMMQYWENIGTIIKALILTYGSYKAVMLTIWAVEKAIDTSRAARYYNLLVEHRQIQKSTALYRAFGTTLKSLKTASSGIAVGAIVGAISLITSAIKKARELDNEINSILSTSATNSENSVSNLNRLVDSLSDATQGSQFYRDIISEINRLYGDYLPKILTEADSYDAVKVAADGAADAIRNKAKAEAFEKGAQAIREKYDKDLGSATDFLKSSLESFNPSISKDAASEFIKHFNEELKKEAEKESPNTMEAFRRTYEKYFGQSYFDSVLSGNKNFGSSFRYSSENLNSAVESYAEIMEDIIEAENELDKRVNDKFTGARFSTLQERTKVLEIERWYNDELNNNSDSLKKLVLTQDEYNKSVGKLNIEKLQKLISIYDDLGRPDVAAKYRKQLETLTKIPDGWRGKVQSLLKDKGLSKSSSFGLWTDDTTSSIDYVDSLIKRYKELGDEINKISSFDDKQAKKLKENKNLIEEVANALGVSLNTYIKNNDELSNRINALKREGDAIKEVMKIYNKWVSSGLFTEEIAKVELGKIYGEDPFVDDIRISIDESGKLMTNFEEMLDKIVSKLEKLGTKGKEAANALRYSIGDSSYKSKVNAEYSEYEKAYNAIEKYYKLLREWSSESFELNGENLIHDISKIASNLVDGNNKVNLKANELKSLLSGLKLGSDVSIDGIKEKFISKFGQDAWDEFWTAYEDKGESAINSLAEKEKEYNRKNAQEKVNDLAKKYVKEAYETHNDKDGEEVKIDFKDLGDKTYKQLRLMRIKLQQIMSQEPLKIPAEVTAQLAGVGVDTSNMENTNLDEAFSNLSGMGIEIDDSTESLIRLVKQLQVAKLNTAKFGEIVKKVLAGDLKNLTNEELKRLAQVGKLAMQEISSLAGALDELGEATNNEALSNAAKAIGAVADVVSDAVNGFASGGWIGAAIAGVGSILEKVLGGIAKSQEALARVRQAAFEYANEIERINFDKLKQSFDSIFGNDTHGKFKALAEEVKKFKENISNSADSIMPQEVIDYINQDLKHKPGFNGKRVDLNVGDFTSDMRTGWQKFWGTGKQNIIHANIKDFLDEDGNLLGDELRAWYEQFGEGLDENSKRIIEDLLENYDLMKDATNEMASYIGSIFGRLADDITNAFVDSFKRTGDAFVDTANMIDSVATTLSKNIVKNMLFENVFNELLNQKVVDSLMNGDVAGSMALIDEAMKQAENMAPVIQEFLEKMKDYFIIGDEGMSLGEGIKGITEDTANLLASYINAIRADVSVAKILLISIDGSVKAIVSALKDYSAPTLLEYQSQIAANTYNNMMYTRDILDKLHSLITFETGMPSIRVYN